MILLDATALVALFANEPGADEVEEILRAGEAAIVSVNLAETIDVLVRVFGYDLDEVEARLVPLLVEDLAVVAADEKVGRRAAELRIDYYDSKELPLSLADCVLLAAGAILNASIATSDAPLAQVAAAEGIDLIPILDSNRRRP